MRSVIYALGSDSGCLRAFPSGIKTSACSFTYAELATAFLEPKEAFLPQSTHNLIKFFFLMFRFWDCAIRGCEHAAAIDIGGCERCQSMYCATHITSSLHTCDLKPLDDEAWTAAQTAELESLSTKTNHAALLRRAKELAGGIECRIDDQDFLGRGMMGGMHIHLQVVFENGVIWLARIPRETFTSFDDGLSNQILLSECATLRWLESLDIPTLRLHGYGLHGDAANEVGVAYMLVDKLPGQPYNAHAASKEQKSKVLGQWAEILCTLSKHPFKALGSLTFSSDNVIKVGPIASDRTGTLPCIGPFNDAKDLYVSWANKYLELIADSQLFSSMSVDAWLMFKLFAEQAEGPWLDQWQNLNSGPFFLKHTDDKGDHILVDENFCITGIIDWTFAKTAPVYEAFGPSLVTANTTSLFSGEKGLSEEDGVLNQELRCQRAPFNHFESDMMRRFLFGLGMGLGLSKDETVNVFLCAVSTFQTQISSWEDWRLASLKRWADDPSLVKLRENETKGLRNSPVTPGISLSRVPRFATCSLSNCERPSVRTRSCSVCSNHLCAVHILPKYHKCPSTNQVNDEAWEMAINKEIDALLEQINIPELVGAASSVRGGKKCTFQPGKHLGTGAIMGCANYHAWIIFDDGVKWLARIPRTTAFSDIPMELIDHLIRSEYATLKWLEDIPIPTPKAHGFGLFSDPENRVGVGYILEDAMEGSPYYAHQATAEQKAHVLNQYADILTKISHYPREKACSLLIKESKLDEGAIASNRFLILGTPGPFGTSLEYFSSLAQIHLELIADGQLYPEYPKEAFLFYKLLRDKASPLLSVPCEDTFFLKHVDDKGDHLLVDDDYNITAIIDWQFARFVPSCEAFGPSLFTADMGKLYSGLTGLSADDQMLLGQLKHKGQVKPVNVASQGELARRFQFGLASGLFGEEVLSMIQAVLSLTGDSGTSNESIEHWLQKEWGRGVGDHWQEKVEKLIADIESESPK